MARTLKPVGERRAPGCRVKGCATQPRRGTALCTVHAQALRSIAAGSVRRIPPADPTTPAAGPQDGLAESTTLRPARTGPEPHLEGDHVPDTSELELEDALKRLAAAEDALHPMARLQFAQESLKAGGYGSPFPEPAKKIWSALHHLINSGGTPERIDVLLAALRDADSDTRLAFALIAGESIEGDPPRADLWSALRDVVWAIGQER